MPGTRATLLLNAAFSKGEGGLPETNLYLSLKEPFSGSRTRAGCLFQLLEDEWQPLSLPPVDISKGPLVDFVVLIEVIGCLDHIRLTPEKVISRQAPKFLLLRNRRAGNL